VDPVIAATIFVFGLCFGSFLNVCIYRLPRDKSVVRPGSACPNCNTPIQFYDNIPVLSWLLLGRRCRQCHAPITARYAAVELLTAGVFVACYARFGLTLEALKYCGFAFLLLGLIFTDAETKLLPDEMTLSGLILGLFFSLFVPVNDLMSMLLPSMVHLPANPNVSWRLLSVADAGLGAVVGASFIYGAGKLYLGFRGVEGMGFGDVKLMAMVGAFLGLRLTVFTLFAASVLGSMFGVATVLAVWIKRTRRWRQRRQSASAARRRAWQSAKLVYRRYELPFGVFLGAMAMLAFFFGNQLLGWYWGQLL
jgi:leader peptidase (prepilin peptidase) / N-methyltransferase